LLIPPGCPDAISEAVLKLLREPVRRRLMGQAARAWVCTHYADERVLRLATSFYISLLRPKLRSGEKSRPAAGEKWGTAWPVLKEASASHSEAKIMGDVRIP
jgi:hypothetical protein